MEYNVVLMGSQKGTLVPHLIEVLDRVPKGRYYDPVYFQAEVDHLWSRVWQMACRLEEIPNVNDFAVYDLLDQSVIVVRTEAGVKAFHNVCKHRGVRLALTHGTCATGFTCPFHGWSFAPDGTNTGVTRRKSFAEHNLQACDLDLTPVRCETNLGCAWINFDDAAPPLRECIEPFATNIEAFHGEAYRVEWWRAMRLPVNWKLAQAAFLEQYHVLESHPQLRILDRVLPRDPAAFDPQQFLRGELQYLRTMNVGMSGMVHGSDVAIAERVIAEIELPADPMLARDVWDRTYNDAVTAWHREAGHDMPDLNELTAMGANEPMAYCFPHHFVLPMYSSASSYRFRPLGPEECLMEIWSLTRYAEGEQRPRPLPPEVWEFDDPRVPPIPAQDYSNLPKQQRGLHSKGFEYLRLAQAMEGGVGNFERTVDAFVTGVSWEKLLPVLRQINVNPLEQSVKDLGF